jgi:hypothetical protein
VSFGGREEAGKEKEKRIKKGERGELHFFLFFPSSG